MYSVAVELTAYCNQKCDYCYNEWREDGGQSIRGGGPTRQLARVRKLLDALDLDHLTLTGGEPFASPILFDVLELARERSVPVHMISNGGVVTPALARRAAPFRIRSVQITLNGATAPLHEEVVGEGHFEKTLAGIGALSAVGVPVVGSIVVTRRNAREVGRILELWQALGARHVALSRFSPAGYAVSHAARLLPSRADLLAAFEQAHPFAARGEIAISCTMPVPPCAVEVERFPCIRFGNCPIGTEMQELALGPDGKLKNCTLHRTALGGVDDVLNDSVDIAALLDAPERSEYRKELPEFCTGCVHATTCLGGCGAAAEWVLGHARRYPDPLVWQHVDTDFGARLAKQRSDGRRHLETIC
jgi:radical SAM protein with 4Fe4S-binding SPASM domain